MKSPIVDLKVALLAAGIVLALCGVGACASRPQVNFGTGLPLVSASQAVKSLEREMFERLNRDRKHNGLLPLSYDERLANVARYHSTDMRDRKFFEHVSPTSGTLEDRLNRAGYLFLIARENLSEAPNVQLSEDTLLQSPPHHANIMARDITHVGIGIVQGGVMAQQNLTVTQVFSKPSRQESPEAARRVIIQTINQQRSKSKLQAIKLHPLLTELTGRYLVQVDPNDGGSTLQRVGKAISGEVAQVKNSGLAGVLLSSQLLADSTDLIVPSPVLSQATARLGIAVRHTANSMGRPMLQVLLLVGK